jgi:hypothetical protein
VVGVAEQRRREALRVAAVGDLADELVDEVPAMGEDQDAAGARGLDEPDGRHRLAGAGRVLEPEAAARAGVLGSLVDLLLVVGLLLFPVLRLFFVLREQLVVGRRGPIRRRVLGFGLAGRAVRAGALGCPVRAAVATAVAVAVLELERERRERAGKRVDLVSGELGAVLQDRRVLVEHALEPEEERVVAPPLHRGVLGAVLDLRKGIAYRHVARRARVEVRRFLALEQNRLARELARALDLGARQRGA